jgi:hypothetical protein
MKVWKGGSLSFDLNLQNVGKLSMQIIIVPIWRECARFLDKESDLIP